MHCCDPSVSLECMRLSALHFHYLSTAYILILAHLGSFFVARPSVRREQKRIDSSPPPAPECWNIFSSSGRERTFFILFWNSGILFVSCRDSFILSIYSLIHQAKSCCKASRFFVGPTWIKQCKTTTMKKLLFTIQECST